MYIVQSLGLTELKTGYMRHPKYVRLVFKTESLKFPQNWDSFLGKYLQVLQTSYISTTCITLHKHICTAIQEYLEKPKANISTFVLHE